MDDIKKFILDNWMLLVQFVFSLIILIIALINVGKKNKTDIGLFIKESILEFLPHVINGAENIGVLSGPDKKQQVIKLTLTYIQKLLHRALSEDEYAIYSAFIGEKTEEILTTPQKKGESL